MPIPLDTHNDMHDSHTYHSYISSSRSTPLHHLNFLSTHPQSHPRMPIIPNPTHIIELKFPSPTYTLTLTSITSFDLSESGEGDRFPNVRSADLEAEAC